MEAGDVLSSDFSEAVLVKHRTAVVCYFSGLNFLFLLCVCVVFFVMFLFFGRCINKRLHPRTKSLPIVPIDGMACKLGSRPFHGFLLEHSTARKRMQEMIRAVEASVTKCYSGTYMCVGPTLLAWTVFARDNFCRCERIGSCWFGAKITTKNV